MFDHPSGVSRVSAVKNTGEAAALVCAKHISSKNLAKLYSSSFKWESFFWLVASAGGSPLDTGHFFLFCFCFCFFPEQNNIAVVFPALW